MINRKLLATIKQLSAETVCHTPVGRSSAQKLHELAMQFIYSNLFSSSSEYILGRGVGKISSEVDPDSGNLILSWNQTVPWREIIQNARVHSYGESAIRAIEVKLRYVIPMFQINASSSVADGQPLRADFVDNLKAFIRDYERIANEPEKKVFRPIATDLRRKNRAASIKLNLIKQP